MKDTQQTEYLKVKGIECLNLTKSYIFNIKDL